MKRYFTKWLTDRDPPTEKPYFPAFESSFSPAEFPAAVGYWFYDEKDPVWPRYYKKGVFGGRTNYAVFIDEEGRALRLSEIMKVPARFHRNITDELFDRYKPPPIPPRSRKKRLKWFFQKSFLDDRRLFHKNLKLFYERSYSLEKRTDEIMDDIRRRIVRIFARTLMDFALPPESILERLRVVYAALRALLPELDIHSVLFINPVPEDFTSVRIDGIHEKVPGSRKYNPHYGWNLFFDGYDPDVMSAAAKGRPVPYTHFLNFAPPTAAEVVSLFLNDFETRLPVWRITKSRSTRIYFDISKVEYIPQYNYKDELKELNRRYRLADQVVENYTMFVHRSDGLLVGKKETNCIILPFACAVGDDFDGFYAVLFFRNSWKSWFEGRNGVAERSVRFLEEKALELAKADENEATALAVDFMYELLKAEKKENRV